MEMLLGLINSLKLDETLFLQFGVFFFSFGVLYYLLFKPYNNAAQVRYDRTVGSEESADKYDEEIELLKRKYGHKVKETNEAVKGIFADFEVKTKKETASLLANAQAQFQQEKAQKEKEVNAHFESEKAKLPAFISDLKDQLKKVLAGV